MKDLEKLRSQLSEVDLKIIDLIHQRQVLAEEIGAYKREKGQPTRDYIREKQVIDLAQSRASSLDLDKEMVVDLMQLLIKSSLKTQEFARVKEEGQGSGKKALVIGGAGRMGGWFAEFLMLQGYSVDIADPNATGSLSKHFLSWEDTEDDYTISVVAAPLRQSIEILQGMLRSNRQGIIFDIASIKSPIQNILKDMVDQGMRVTSIHPMFGPDSNLLTGKQIIFMDIDQHDSQQTVKKLFESTTAQLIEMSIENHDYAISYVLGLSHMVNIAFAKVLASSKGERESLPELSSTTFKDQLNVAKRVTDENPHLYYEIQHLNEHSLKTIQELNTAISEITEAITQGYEEDFVAMMEKGQSYFVKGK